MNFKEILYSYLYKPEYITTCYNNEYHKDLSIYKEYIVYKHRYMDGYANQLLLLNDKNKLEWYSVFIFINFSSNIIDTFGWLRPYKRKRLRFNFITFS